MNFSDSDPEDRPTTRYLRDAIFAQGLARQVAAPPRARVTYQPSIERRAQARRPRGAVGSWPYAGYPAAHDNHDNAPDARPRAPAPSIALPREPSFSEPQRASPWSFGALLIAGAVALVAAGYLGALVQMRSSYPGPVLIPRLVNESPTALPSASSAQSAARPNLPPARASAGAGALPAARSLASQRQAPASAVKTRSRVTHPTLSTRGLQPTAATITADTAELYHQRPPVMSIRRLSPDETASNRSMPAVETSSDAATPTTLQQPRREDVQLGLDRMHDQLVACAAGRHGRLNARLTIAATGRVKYSLIEGAFAGTPEGSCMARALRAVKLPSFAGSSFKVLYPFSL